MADERTAVSKPSIHAAAVAKVEDVYPLCGHVEKFIVNMRKLPCRYQGVRCEDETHNPSGPSYNPFTETYTANGYTDVPTYDVEISLFTDGVFAPEFRVEWKEVK